jgi:hypothetical protein
VPRGLRPTQHAQVEVGAISKRRRSRSVVVVQRQPDEFRRYDNTLGLTGPWADAHANDVPRPLCTVSRDIASVGEGGLELRSEGY